MTSRARQTLATVVVASAAVGCGSGDAASSQSTTVPTSITTTSTQAKTQVASPRSTATTTPRQRPTGALRFASTPVVLFAELRPGSGSYLISIVFKMRRLLPEASRRNVRATVLVGDVRSMFPLGRFSRRRPCYDQEFDEAPPGSPLEKPRDGQSVTVTVRIKGHPTRKVTIEAVMRKASPRRVAEPTAEDVARIGCKGERPG